MGRTFRRHGDAIRATFQPLEVELLRSTRDQLASALAVHDPDDPIVQRLFPTAVLGDAEADQDLRSLVHDDLLASRLAGLDALVELLDRARPHRGGLRVELRDDEPLLVLGVLNDLRLAIGARLDIEAIDRDRIDPDDPVAYRLAVMDLLAWWQEQLLGIIDPPSVQVSQELDLDDLEGPGDPRSDDLEGPDDLRPDDRRDP